MSIVTNTTNAADGDRPLLDVIDLQVEFRMRDGIAHAINGVSFSVSEGETLANPALIELCGV